MQGCLGGVDDRSRLPAGDGSWQGATSGRGDDARGWTGHEGGGARHENLTFDELRQILRAPVVGRFRHDAARRLVETVDLPTVAALLGHSRLDTIRIYAQPDESALQRAVVALESR